MLRRPTLVIIGVQVTEEERHLLFVARSSCCWNKALVSVIMVAISCLRSWILAARSVSFWLLFLVVFELLASVFIRQSISTSASSYVLFNAFLPMITCYAPSYGLSSRSALTTTYASRLDYENSLLTILIDCKEEKAPEPWN